MGNRLRSSRLTFQGNLYKLWNRLVVRELFSSAG